MYLLCINIYKEKMNKTKDSDLDLVVFFFSNSFSRNLENKPA